MRSIRPLVAVASAVSVVALGGGAAAQEVAATSAKTTVATTSDTPAPTDHSLVVRKLGVGYFNQFDVPFSADGTGAVPTQLVGVRYWFQESLAIDLALGWGMSAGSRTTAGQSRDTPSTLGFALKAGVPIALYSGHHYTFVVNPQLILGHAGRTAKNVGGAPDSSDNGNRFVIGASAGGIIHFGFIGIPELTLDAMVGIFADFQGASSKGPGTGPAGGTVVESSFSRYDITTLNFSAPWRIFTSNVAAIYHFR